MEMVDFNHWKGAQIGDMIASNVNEQQMLQVIHYLKPEFGKDGNQFYYLYGKDLQEGIAGFGDTAFQAMQKFCTAFYTEKAKTSK